MLLTTSETFFFLVIFQTNFSPLKTQFCVLPLKSIFFYLPVHFLYHLCLFFSHSNVSICIYVFAYLPTRLHLSRCKIYTKKKSYFFLSTHIAYCKKQTNKLEFSKYLMCTCWKNTNFILPLRQNIIFFCL